MAVVPDQTIASAARAAGFPSGELATAVAVALAESGGNATATNHNTNGTTDYGLWQINSIHRPELGYGSWQDPNTNARMAYSIWVAAGRKWTPWMAWKAGKHLAFLPRGAAAAGTAPDNADPVTPVENVGITDTYNDVAFSVQRVFDTLADKDLWIRFGIYLLGFVFLVVGVIGLIWVLGGKDLVKDVAGIALPG